jgi:hypothetical protein
MDEAAIIAYITETFAGVDAHTASRESGAPEIAWGDTFFFYDPDHTMPEAQRFPFATIVTKDYGDFDAASWLDRPGVFRLNVGMSGETFRALFGPPSSHSASQGSDTTYDYAALDQLLPHPVYASQSWVCILNPSRATFEKAIAPLLAEAYERAAGRYTRRAART